MGLIDKTIDELIDIAMKTTCIKEMLFLQNYPAMNVRRALAKNRNIYDEVLLSLMYDPVQNVSYIANNHPKAKNNRDFGEVRVCVSCQKAEKGLDCRDCPHLKPYNDSY